MPTLALSMIVRDCEPWIRACLDSVRDIVDEMVVVDTGSVDRTAAIAEEMGAKVYRFQWCDDFSAALNFGLRHTTSDWVLRLDGDEELDPDSAAELLNIVAQNERGFYHVNIISRLDRGGVTEYVQSRMARLYPREGIQWRGAIHEILTSATPEPAPPFMPSEIRVTHHGYADPALERQKQERNLALLDAAIEREPLLAINHHYRGISRQILGRHEEAVEDLARAIRLAQNQHEYKSIPSWTLTTYAAMASSCLALGSAEAAKVVCDASKRYTGNYAPLRLNDAQACLTLGRYDEGLEAALDALICTDSGEAIDANAGTWKALAVAAHAAHSCPDGGAAVLKRKVKRETAMVAPPENAMLPAGIAR